MPPPATAEDAARGSGQEKPGEPVKAEAAKQQVNSRSQACRESESGSESRGASTRSRGGAACRRCCDAEVAQYVQQFRPMFRAEYYFIRNTCELNTDQRKQLAKVGETAVKAAARQFVEAQQKMMRGGWRPGSEYPDPRKFIEEELTRVVEPAALP